MNVHKPNSVSGSILLVIAAGYGYMIINLPNRNLPNTMGANFMPILFDIALGLLSIALLSQGLRGRAGGNERGPVKPLTIKDVIGIIFVFALFFAYIFLINVVGFLIVTPLVLLALLLLQGIRKPWSIVTVCIAVTVGVYLLFRYGFDVQITGIAIP